MTGREDSLSEGSRPPREQRYNEPRSAYGETEVQRGKVASVGSLSICEAGIETLRRRAVD